MLVLALLASGISALFVSGLQSLDVQSDRTLCDCLLRSAIEEMISKNFSLIQSGTRVLNMNGQNYTVTFTVTPVDLDNNAFPETNAVEVTASITDPQSRSLTTLVVDNEGKVGKM